VNRRTLPVAAALTTAAALLLAACGTGDDSKSKDTPRIIGAEQSAEPSASPAPTVSAIPGRPEIVLPADLTYTFDWRKTGDKDKDAVLADGEQFIKATDLAVAKQDPLDKAYQFYSEGTMAAATQKYVQGYVDDKQRTTGHFRFYDENVTVKSDGTATLSYCEDQSQAFGMYIKTKKVDKTPVDSQSYILYNTGLRKNEKGVWVTTEMITSGGNAKCQP
jgi:hypothetical protein